MPQTAFHMKRTLIFASNNSHKAEEIRKILDDQFRIITLKEAGIEADIPEPHDSFHENALEKSRFIHRLTGTDCFAEDSGLEVTALDGAPGVRSARYAGAGATDHENVQKLLSAMETCNERSARFRTVISLIIDNKELFFEGACNGHITRSPSGENGFGYDPVFVPEGEDRSFAEMNMEEKSKISHRKKAVQQMAAYLLHQHDIS